MSRNWKVLILAVITVLLVSGGAEFVGIALLVAFLPVYALMLASIMLILCVGLAGIIVPIGRSLLDRHNAAPQSSEKPEERAA